MLQLQNRQHHILKDKKLCQLMYHLSLQNLKKNLISINELDVLENNIALSRQTNVSFDSQ